MDEVKHVAERILRLGKAIDDAVREAPAEVTVSELGSLSRFESPRQSMGYSGLVASEHSSGNRIQRGSITKTGNARLRRVVVEAACCKGRSR